MANDCMKDVLRSMGAHRLGPEPGEAKMMRHAMRGAAAMACLLAPILICGASSAQGPPSQDFQKAMEAYHKLPDTAGTGPFPAAKSTDPAFPGHVVYRPADVGKLGGR